MQGVLTCRAPAQAASFDTLTQLSILTASTLRGAGALYGRFVQAMGAKIPSDQAFDDASTRRTCACVNHPAKLVERDIASQSAISTRIASSF